MDADSHEFYFYQDCSLTFKINKTDIDSCSIDPALVPKADKVGKALNYLPFVISMKNGEKHVIYLNNSYKNKDMYKPSGSASSLKAGQEHNQKILEGLKAYIEAHLKD